MWVHPGWTIEGHRAHLGVVTLRLLVVRLPGKRAANEVRRAPLYPQFRSPQTANQKHDVFQQPLASFCRESQNNRIKAGVRAFFPLDFFHFFSFFS
jgi:hypothetical protein